jgi:hypothetical protein
MHVAICTRSGRSLRRDPSALRFRRSLTPFGECLGLDAMQVISLEGCVPLGHVNPSLILRSVFHRILLRVPSDALESVQSTEQREHSTRILLAEQPQADRVSFQDPLL